MNNALFALADGDIVELPDARGTRLRVGRGNVWITQERAWHDVVLARGDVWTVERNGLTLLEARGSTTVTVSARPSSRRLRIRVRARWIDGIEAWLRAAGERLVHRRFVPYV